ncbi:MAG: hypothetical protein LAN61_10505 [Acidobacteriia bacterium]|nr:hypothetical protein [Terriglobia bacterium]
MTAAVVLAVVALAATLKLWAWYVNRVHEAARREQQQFAEHVRRTHAARQNLEQ